MGTRTERTVAAMFRKDIESDAEAKAVYAQMVEWISTQQSKNRRVFCVVSKDNKGHFVTPLSTECDEYILLYAVPKTVRCAVEKLRLIYDRDVVRVMGSEGSDFVNDQYVMEVSLSSAKILYTEIAHG